MSDVQTKRPAHEVILSKLRQRMDELHGVEQVHSREAFSAVGAVAALLDVLHEMVIPDKAREDVLARLRERSDCWPEAFGPNMVGQLHDMLVDER